MAISLVRVEVFVAVEVPEPVMRSGETQVADFVLPALADLQEATTDVLAVWASFEELPQL